MTSQHSCPTEIFRRPDQLKCWSNNRGIPFLRIREEWLKIKMKTIRIEEKRRERN
jgi:hypothetical protein